MLTDTKYVLPPMLKAPVEAFDNESEWFFAGTGVDDLFLTTHLSFKFFGMQALPAST